MSTKWASPLTEARPPAPRHRLDLARVAIYLLTPFCFWLAVALLLYAKGWWF